LKAKISISHHVNLLEKHQQSPSRYEALAPHLGHLETDFGLFFRRGGTSTKSSPNAELHRERCVMISALIENPTEGLILFETGAGPDYPE
jgi:hypothetical protein